MTKSELIARIYLLESALAYIGRYSEKDTNMMGHAAWVARQALANNPHAVPRNPIIRDATPTEKPTNDLS